MLKTGTKALQVDLFNAINGDHHMGIAHAGCGDGKALTVNLQLPLGEARRPHRQGRGHLLRHHEGGAHVDANPAVVEQLRHDPSGQGVDLPGATGPISIDVGQEARQAADAVAAHFRLTAIGIEDAHAQLTTGTGGQRQDHAIGSDAEAPVTQLSHPIGREAEGRVRFGSTTAIQHQEVVAQPLVLAELKLAERRHARQPAHTGVR